MSASRGPKDASTLVFTYGTLLRGESNAGLLKGSKRVAKTRTLPGFRLYDFGAYPGLVQGGKQAVPGEVYAVSAETLARLDHLEEHPDFYRRTPLVLEDGTTAETYLLPSERVKGRPIIISGCWRTHQRARTLTLEMRDGRLYRGTALQIVRAMQDLTPGLEKLTLRQFIVCAVAHARKSDPAVLAVTGRTDEELAHSLVREFLRSGLGRRR